MGLLPASDWTLVLSLSANEALALLQLVTTDKTASYLERYGKEQVSDYLFLGRIEGSKFEISKRVRHPQNYLPLANGRIESTSSGAILFARFRLFFGSRILIWFWLTVTFLAGVYFATVQIEPLVSALSFGFFILNLVVTHASFRAQVRQTRQLIEELLLVEPGA